MTRDINAPGCWRIVELEVGVNFDRPFGEASEAADLNEIENYRGDWERLPDLLPPPKTGRWRRSIILVNLGDYPASIDEVLAWGRANQLASADIRTCFAIVEENPTLNQRTDVNMYAVSLRIPDLFKFGGEDEGDAYFFWIVYLKDEKPDCKFWLTEDSTELPEEGGFSDTWFAFVDESADVKL